MLLNDVFATYRTIRRVGDGAAYQIDRSCRVFGEWLGRPATVEDLTDKQVSEWACWLETEYAGETAYGHRSRLLGVWRFAARRKLCDPPAEVRPIPRPEPMPVANTVEDVEKLIAACDQMREVLSGGVTLGEYLACVVGVCYASGLRRGDVWGLHRSEILPDGTLRRRMHKTGHVICPRIPPDLAARVLRLPGEMPLAWHSSPRMFSLAWQRMRALAGVACEGPQQLRKTGATWVAHDHGIQAAREFLGHKTLGMVRYYVDQAIAAPQPHQPPKLAG